MTPRMLSVTRRAFGGPEVLRIEEIARPAPGLNDILVQVQAFTVNRTDCGFLTGKPYAIRLFAGFRTPKQMTLGTDFAGQVVQVGSAVTKFKEGDRVWGVDTDCLSSHAQYMVIGADKAVAILPDNMSYEQGAAAAEGGHYAYNFVRYAALQKGRKAIVNGATGAIGSAALQILKAQEIIVTATANTKNLGLIQQLGADKIYNFETEDFTTDNDQYHCVFDTVGKSRFKSCKHLLLPKGLYMSSELGPHAENLYLPLTTLFSNRRVVFPIPVNHKRSVEALNKLMAEDRFIPVIDSVRNVKEIQEVYAYVASGQKTGQVVITF